MLVGAKVNVEGSGPTDREYIDYMWCVVAENERKNLHNLDASAPPRAQLQNSRQKCSLGRSLRELWSFWPR